MTSVLVNRKTYNDIREKEHANERVCERQRDGFCFVFYCLDIVNTQTSVRTCVVGLFRGFRLLTVCAGQEETIQVFVDQTQEKTLAKQNCYRPPQ